MSLDGKIDGGFFNSPELKPYLQAYSQIRSEYDYQAILNGTTTCAEIYANGFLKTIPSGNENIPIIDHLENVQPGLSLALCLDPEGKLSFDQSFVDRGGNKMQIVEILLESVNQGYLQYLQEKSIPYLFSGKENIDFPLLMTKLKEKLDIQTLLVTGGGILDWSLLEQGLVDELSIVMAPLVSAEKKAASLFERSRWADRNLVVSFSLEDVQRIEPDGLWLIYQPNNAKG